MNAELILKINLCRALYDKLIKDYAEGRLANFHAELTTATALHQEILDKCGLSREEIEASGFLVPVTKGAGYNWQALIDALEKA